MTEQFYVISDTTHSTAITTQVRLRAHGAADHQILKAFHNAKN